MVEFRIIGNDGNVQNVRCTDQDKGEYKCIAENAAQNLMRGVNSAAHAERL